MDFKKKRYFKIHPDDVFNFPYLEYSVVGVMIMDSNHVIRPGTEKYQTLALKGNIYIYDKHCAFIW